MAKKAKMWRSAIIDSYILRNGLNHSQVAKILRVSESSYYRYRQENWSSCDLGKFIVLVERLRMSDEDARIAIYGKERV